MTAPVVVILAAGQGTRMRSATPKVLHPLCGRPLLLWPIAAARAAGAQKVVVVGGPDRALAGHLPDGDDVVLAVQQEPRGTADAVLSAAQEIDRDAPVDRSSPATCRCSRARRCAISSMRTQRTTLQPTMLTMVLADPSGYGRVVRGPDGGVERVVETKKPGDATPQELEIREVNGGVYAFHGGKLLDALAQVKPDNAQGELYLPDVLPLLRARDEVVAAHLVDDPTLALGINDQGDLAAVRAIAQAAHPRAPAGARRHDRRPRLDRDRRRRRDRPGHGRRPLQLAARRDARRRQLHDRPAHDADRHDARRPRQRRRTPT